MAIVGLWQTMDGELLSIFNVANSVNRHKEQPQQQRKREAPCRTGVNGTKADDGRQSEPILIDTLNYYFVLFR